MRDLKVSALVGAVVGCLLVGGIVGAAFRDGLRNTAHAIAYIAPKQMPMGVAKSEPQPEKVESLAFVREVDHDILVGPVSLSAARREALKYDPDSVEIITQDMPAYALADQELQERFRIKIAERDK